MSDDDLGGNRTVFRPSPLQALKSGGASAPAPSLRSPPFQSAPPPSAVGASPPVAAPAVVAAPRGRAPWRTVLMAVFVIVSVLAIGYVVLQLTGTAPAAAPAAKTGATDRGAVPLGGASKRAMT